MTADSISQVAQLVGEPGRLRMLITLLNGTGQSASELAMAAGVSPQTASSHLSKLLTGGLVVCEQTGRQRVFRLKSRDVANAVEALGALAHGPHERAMPEIRFARTCYDHLAGVLAIALRNELLRSGVLLRKEDGFDVSGVGKKAFKDLNIDVDSLRRMRRGFGNRCLDWTERHHHIGGALGAALLSRLIDSGCIARVRGTRAVRVTHAGERRLEELFGIRCAALRARESARVKTAGAGW
jgi:DNA-binding transcriptional ArsR family regulator